MSSKNNLNDQVAMMVASSKPSNGVGDESATDAVARILRRRLEKEDQEEEQRAREQAEYRKQQLDSIERAMRERRLGQEGCVHMKPNFTTALNGQRDHQGELHGVCSYCAKEFTEEELRQPQFRHLAMAGDRVGGPIR